MKKFDIHYIHFYYKFKPISKCKQMRIIEIISIFFVIFFLEVANRNSVNLSHQISKAVDVIDSSLKYLNFANSFSALKKSKIKIDPSGPIISHMLFIRTFNRTKDVAGRMGHLKVVKLVLLRSIQLFLYFRFLFSFFCLLLKIDLKSHKSKIQQKAQKIINQQKCIFSPYLTLFSIGMAFLNLTNAKFTACTRFRSLAFLLATRCGGFWQCGTCLKYKVIFKISEK